MGDEHSVSKKSLHIYPAVHQRDQSSQRGLVPFYVIISEGRLANDGF